MSEVAYSKTQCSKWYCHLCQDQYCTLYLVSVQCLCFFDRGEVLNLPQTLHRLLFSHRLSLVTLFAIEIHMKYHCEVSLYLDVGQVQLTISSECQSYIYQAQKRLCFAGKCEKRNQLIVNYQIISLRDQTLLGSQVKWYDQIHIIIVYLLLQISVLVEAPLICFHSCCCWW